jgi:excisionase family DNA binding protein
MPGYKDMRDTARMLGVARATIYHMIWRGEIDTIKVGKLRLVSEASIRRTLAKREAH